MQTHERITHDTLTPIAAALKQVGSDGAIAAVDLSGKTVKFTMRSAAGAVVVDEGDATVTDAANGLVQYDFAAGDVDIAGTYYAWFHVYVGDERDTYPAAGRSFRVIIRDAE